MHEKYDRDFLMTYTAKLPCVAHTRIVGSALYGNMRQTELSLCYWGLAQSPFSAEIRPHNPQILLSDWRRERNLCSPRYSPATCTCHMVCYFVLAASYAHSWFWAVRLGMCYKQMVTLLLKCCYLKVWSCWVWEFFSGWGKKKGDAHL